MELINKNVATGGNERFYIRLPETGTTVFIEYTMAVASIVRPALTNVFGMPFLDSKAVEFGDLVKHEFEANQHDIDLWYTAMRIMTNNSIIKSLEIINS